MTTPAFQICIDAADPHLLNRFWAAATGYEVEDHHDQHPRHHRRRLRHARRHDRDRRAAGVEDRRRRAATRTAPGRGCCSSRCRSEDGEEPGAPRPAAAPRRRGARGRGRAVDRARRHAALGRRAGAAPVGDDGRPRGQRVLRVLSVGRLRRVRAAASPPPRTRRARRTRLDPEGQPARLAPAHEALDVDDDAHDLADGDEAALVGRRHGERQPTALGLGQHGLGDHLGADRRRLQVIEAHLHADGGRARREHRGDAAAARLLAQGEQPRCAEHVDVPRSRGRAPYPARPPPSPRPPARPSPPSRLATLTPREPRGHPAAATGHR